MERLETALNWFYERKGKVRYSMAARNGPNSYDCSSAVYYALKSAGLLPQSIGIGNTDSLFGDLESNGWTTTNTPKRGVIFIWGKRGYSGGKYGHTGMFINSTQIIHCTSSGNGIVVGNHTPGSTPYTLYVNNNLVDDEEEAEEEPVINIGELDYLGIKEGKIVAEGWHYSQDKDIRTVQFINAQTDAIIATVTPETIKREDLKEEYPNATNIENSGFRASISVASGTSVYVKGILKSQDRETDELIFDGIITYEVAYDIETNNYASYHTGFFYEIYDGDTIKYRGNKLIDGLNWHNELMYTPQLIITVPIYITEYINGNEEILVYVNRKVFHGLVTSWEEDKASELLRIELIHVINEWNYRQISTNLAAKDRTINDIYSTLDFRYPGWNIEYLDDSARYRIDYVYSRQSKLEGLTKTCELTDDLFWRVGFNFGRKLQIGRFGEEKVYKVTTSPPTARNIQMIEEPVINHDTESVINIATVYGEKSDSGMSSMSLREIYEEPAAQVPGFPVVILTNEVNNERNYNYVEFTKLAPNNDVEYTILDEESIALESGIIKEGTFAFNDLAPFNIESEEITDEDRAKQVLMAYHGGVKKLRQSRRKDDLTMPVSELPPELNVGDKILLQYDNLLNIMGDCGNYFKKILTINEYFYITAIDYEIDEIGNEIDTITLDKYLRTQRETEYQ